MLITGAGPIGQMAAAICRHTGVRHVVVSDIKKRLALADRMGATRGVVAGRESLATVMEELGMKESFDIGLEMSRAPVALDDMIASANNGAHIGQLGIYHGPVTVDLNKAIFKGPQ